MLKLINDSDNQLTLLHDNCTFDKTGVQFAVLKFTKPYVIDIVVKDSTTPSIRNFIDKDKTILLNLTVRDLEGSNFSLDANQTLKGGVYEIDYYIALTSTKTVTGFIEGNIIQGVGLLSNFNTAKHIILNNSPNQIYEIDKQRSLANSLFLKTPVRGLTTILSYNPVFKSKEFFVSTDTIKKTILKEIQAINICIDCDTTKIDALTLDVINLYSIANSVNCGNSDGAKKLYKNLNSKYPKC